MADKPKSARPALPPHLRRPVLLGLGGVALLVGLGVLFQAWQSWRSAGVAPHLEAVRSALATQLGEQVAAARGRLTAVLADSYVHADLAAGAREDAAQRVRTAWPEATLVQFYEPTLDDAFSGDLRAQGFTRLALLHAAQTSGEPRADLAGAQQPELGLAAPVVEGEQTLAIAYVAIAAQPLFDPVASADAGAGHLDLRAGTRVLATQGAPIPGVALALTPVPGTSLQLASSAPVAQSWLDLPPPLQLGIGVAALLLGALLLRQALRPSAAEAEAQAEPTFSEALSREPAAVAAPAAPRRVPEAPKPTTQVDRSIFRAYDIRGVVGQTLDEGVARLIGQAVGTLMREQGLKEIVVGRDGRLSGPQLSAALIEGLRRAGRDVIDIGLAPTPLVYFGTFHLNTGCGIAVTGSHNPPDYNGFKLVVGGETLSGKAVQDLYVRIAENRLDGGGGGGLQTLDILDDYVQRIASDIQLERKLKVVVDAGNGVAGAVAPQVLEAIGAEVVPLYCEVDGEFPNHHPDPSEPKNLTDLVTFVGKFGADLGLAFDGDGDRLGVVTRHGENVFPDRVLMLFAQDVLSRNPGASVIYDVKCTGHLAGQILRHGGSPIMWKTGHSLIKAKMRETEAELAGEMSGHFFFRERWFGFDDAIYSSARLLEILASDEREPEAVFSELPKGVSTPELKVPMAEGEHYAFMERFRERARFDGAKIATIDGVRADWADGWGLVRCSNTTPCLVLRFDADSAEALARIQELFRQQLLAVDPGLALPF